jgi:hypothetical protein
VDECKPLMPGSSIGVLVQGAATVGGGGLRVRLVSTATDKSAAAIVIAASVDAGGSDDAVIEAGDGRQATAGDGTSEMANQSITVTAPETGSDVLIIETDKPVYKPGQTVKVRVLSLTRALLPRPTTVTVTVKNPQSFAMAGTIFIFILHCSSSPKALVLVSLTNPVVRQFNRTDPVKSVKM